MTTSDFTFSWEGAGAPGGPWAHLEVIQFRGTEEISALYRYEVILLARTPAPEVDPRNLVHARATLRINTGTEPRFKVLHGVIAEVEELGGLPEGMLYRIVLMPPLVRSAYRTRCRIFLEKTIREIIDAVLKGEPLLSRMDGASVDPDDGNMSSFAPAVEVFTWRITNSPRLDQRFARPYCVQYNESDLAFVSRLLEDEGISYHFENGDGACLLVLSDEDTGKSRLDPFAPLGTIVGREVGSMKLGGRLRPKVVSMDDYNWKKPSLDMRVEASAAAGTGGLVEYHWPGGYAGEPAQGQPLARAAAERYGVEADYAVGEGYCRILSAGSIFQLQHAKARYEGEYLVTKLEVRGEQVGVLAPGGFPATGIPYSCRFECARRGHDGTVAASGYRPERRTPKPRVHGSQTAFVTAEPTASDAIVNVGDLVGCVRLKFHWDHDTERLAKEPSSCWVRVSQMFAGGGQGAVGHPRVGVEVIVEFLDGDPDRPIVTGRVYNGANLPPAEAEGCATATVIKTYSVPGYAQYNEIRLEDSAGKEELRVHAGKNLVHHVEHDSDHTVRNDSRSTVDGFRWEETGLDRHMLVRRDNFERIGGNDRHKVDRNQKIIVDVNQTTSVGGDQGQFIKGSQKTTISEGQIIKIGFPTGAGDGDGDSTLVGQTIEIKGGPQNTTIHEGGQTITIKDGGQTTDVTGDYSVTATSGLFTAVSTKKMTLIGQAQDFIAAGANGPDKQTFVSKDLVMHASDTGSIATDNTLDISTTNKLSLNATNVMIDASNMAMVSSLVNVTLASRILVDIGSPCVRTHSEVVSTTGTKKLDMSGGEVSVTGTGEVVIKGSIIKLNAG